jgi:hypothetical protein
MKNLHNQFVLAFFAGQVNGSQQPLIEYLKTENEIYCEKLGKRRTRFASEQRRRLIETPRVQIAGIVRQACDEWIKQIARDLSAPVDGFILGRRYFIHARDPLSTKAFRKTLRDIGVEPLRLLHV